MNPLWGQVIGVVTVVTMLTFVAIWAWVWLPRHKHKFRRLSMMPMRDAVDPRDPERLP